MRIHPKTGFAMITVLLMLVVLMALLGAYFALTRVEQSTRKSSAIGVAGFYAAEGGLNLRAETIRAKFIGYARPTGSAPTTTGSNPPCQGSNTGSGDFACQSYTLGGQTVQTYVTGGGPGRSITIPPGDDKFAGLSAIQYTYSVYAEAYGPSGKPSAIVQMDFLSRLVPLFQFAAFYQNDLEIEPSPPMTLDGPVHTNGNLYLDPHNTLNVNGQITTAGKFYLGQSPNDVGNHIACQGTVRVADKSGNLQTLPGCAPHNHEVTYNDVKSSWGNQIQPESGHLTIPDVSALNPSQGNDFWDNADLRVMVDATANPPALQVEDANGLINAAATAAITACADLTAPNGHNPPSSSRALYLSDSFYNNREGTWITMINVDTEKLMTCIHDHHTSLGFDIDDSTNNGLVWYFGFSGSQAGNNCTSTSTGAGCINDYGVRLLKGSALGSNELGAPQVQGLTVVTNQAAYVQGDYNVGGTLGGISVPKKPAAVIADSMNVLSNSWNDSHSGHNNNPNASSTTINAAFLSGTDLSGPPSSGSTTYSGGLENYPRFHENWSGDTLHYRGSFVSLGLPLHVDGRWANQVYNPPNRDFNYDTDFKDVNNLPPLTPRFVYLKQLLFARQFSR